MFAEKMTPDTTIYNTASSLLTQLQAVESLCEDSARTNNTLRQKRLSLQESLRLFQTIEDNEKTATKELQHELCEAMERVGGVWKFNFECPAPQMDLKLLTEGSAFASISTCAAAPTTKPPAPKTNIFTDCLAQINTRLAPAARGYVRLDDDDVTPKKHNGRALAAARRFLAERMRQKVKRTSWDGEGMRKTRKRGLSKSQITHKGLAKRT